MQSVTVQCINLQQRKSTKHLPPSKLTLLPAWLLCRLICDWMSPPFSRVSRKSSENSAPKAMLCEQPPHFHRLACLVFSFFRLSSTRMLFSFMASRKRSFSFSRLSRSDLVIPFRVTEGSQPHEMSLPWAQARATLCVTPAAATAYANALSR